MCISLQVYINWWAKLVANPIQMNVDHPIAHRDQTGEEGSLGSTQASQRIWAGLQRGTKWSSRLCCFPDQEQKGSDNHFPVSWLWWWLAKSSWYLYSMEILSIICVICLCKICFYLQPLCTSFNLAHRRCLGSAVTCGSGVSKRLQVVLPFLHMLHRARKSRALFLRVAVV